jgi:hypothetical protein
VRVHGSVDGGKNVGRDCLDVHVDEDEPVLVVQVNEVLHGVDVAERNWPSWIEPLPVVQRVPVVTQNRRPPEQLARLAERNCEISREQIHRRLRNLVDVG